jgi:phosphopantothenoylcysteine decarboxylase/phosphopantothenate--cysteine ligase
VAVDLPTAKRLTVVRTESAEAMRTALLATLRTPTGSAGFDALVMAAAVADFRPARRADRKLERGASLALELESTPDIVAELAREVGGASGQALDPRPVLVGFAAETGSLERAAGKLVRKGLDLLVANDVAEPGSGFGTETNRVTIYARPADPAGPVTADPWPLVSKRVVADRLLDLVARRLDERDAGRQTEPGESAASTSPPAPQESLR